MSMQVLEGAPQSANVPEDVGGVLGRMYLCTPATPSLL